MGAWLEDNDKIMGVFQQYFQDIFTSKIDLDLNKVVDAIEPKVIDEMNNSLTILLKLLDQTV